jgi:hypothetical protein
MHDTALARHATRGTLPPFLFIKENPQRLSEHGAPFGMLENHNQTSCSEKVAGLQAAALDTAELHPRIPSGSRCAIVGNSGSLLGSHLGPTIDAHDIVIRMNAAPSGGVWADDVGSKADLRILAGWTAQMRVVHPNDTRSSASSGTLLYCLSSWVGDCFHRGTSAPDPQQARRWLLNPALVHLVRDLMMNRTTLKRHSVPSTGLLGAAIAKDMCASVSLFGFGNVTSGEHESSNRTTDSFCEHYYECALAEGRFADYQSQTKYHDFASEARLMQIWATESNSFVIHQPKPERGSRGNSLRRQSAMIEDRWRRQFSVAFVPRSKNGVHFPPEKANASITLRT